jgi:hypothetical protein
LQTQGGPDILAALKGRSIAAKLFKQTVLPKMQ